MASIGITLGSHEDHRAALVDYDTPAVLIEGSNGTRLTLYFRDADQQGVVLLCELMNEIFAEMRSRHLQEIAKYAGAVDAE